MASKGLGHTLFSLDGRLGRGVYWGWVLFCVIVQFGASYWAAMTVADQGTQVMQGAARGMSILVSLLLLWPGLAIVVKRWHDVDKSGGWVLINFVPIIGWIISLVFNGFIPGTQGQNRFGPQIDKHSSAIMMRALIPLLLAILALLLLITSGPGSRMGWWDFRTGFVLMRWAVYLGLATAVLALLLLAIPRTRRGNARALLLGAVIGIAAAAVPLYGLIQAKSLPMIHDISTDTMHPPEFVTILPLRADAPNSATYGGHEVAAAQKAGYPDIRTQILDLTTADAFARAEKVARDMGWEIVAVVPEAGRIEATDTTFWYGFKDDIVIRIEAEGEASRVDIRSLSRVGKSDVGKNAKRIRAFISQLDSRPSPP